MNPDTHALTYQHWSPSTDVVAQPAPPGLYTNDITAESDHHLDRLRLSWAEREFLQKLLTSRYVGYEEAALALLHRTDAGATRAVYRFVNKLKRKLGPLGTCIQAARGTGYVWQRPSDQVLQINRQAHGEQ